MLSKIFLLLLGIIIMSYSLFFIIVYLNLMDMGYSFLEYLSFIAKRFECLLLIPGIIIIAVVERKEKNEIHL